MFCGHVSFSKLANTCRVGLFLVLNSVREHQVRNGRLQPVPGDHFADFRRAVVGELEVGAPGAGLKVQI